MRYDVETIRGALRPKPDLSLDRRGVEFLEQIKEFKSPEHAAIGFVRNFLIAAGYIETAEAFAQCLEFDDASIKRRADEVRAEMNRA